MAKTWFWKLDDLLTWFIGPAQLVDPAEDKRRDEARAAEPPVAPRTLIPGGHEVRGTPGHRYIVRSAENAEPGETA